VKKKVYLEDVSIEDKKTLKMELREKVCEVVGWIILGQVVSTELLCNTLMKFRFP
jgi:hypothetical protein